MGNGLMNSRHLSDELGYQNVNLVEKKIYPPLALAFGRHILTVRIHFLNSGLVSVFILYPDHTLLLLPPKEKY
jgi:hypothetical protein